MQKEKASADRANITTSSVSEPSTNTAERVSGLHPFVFATVYHDNTGVGLAKAIMLDHQKAAQAANLPIWLEATTPGSRSLYLSMGFEEVEKIMLGKGKVAADASLQPGGPGVPLWAMLWWPHPEPTS